MYFRQIFDRRLAQYAYLIGCQRTGEALIIDPQRDVDRYLEAAAAEGLRLVAAAETHVHADFLSGARQLATQYGVKVYLSGEGGDDWRYAWASPSQNPEHDRPEEYEIQDREINAVELKDGDTFTIGHIEILARHTPGHTPEHLAYFVIDRGAGIDEPMGIASGDFVFVGDVGRPDLLESAAGESGAMEPSARRLYQSVLTFLELPDHLQLWPGHGAGSSCGKALGAVPFSTVGYEKRTNASLRAADGGEDAFVRAILDGQPEPPLYFGRMKRENRDGPKILNDGLPRPHRLTSDELASYSEDGSERDSTCGWTCVVDTRLDRRAFMAGHLRGSLFAPLDKSFPTVAGSYLEPGRLIVLVIDEENVDDAVRELVRIGLDDVVAWATPDDLERIPNLASIDVIDFDAVDVLVRSAEADCYQLVDVRRQAEFDAGSADGAVNVAHTRLAARLGELPTDRDLLVHCAVGGRAAVAAAFLASRGRRVRLVDDAVAPWLARRH